MAYTASDGAGTGGARAGAAGAGAASAGGGPTGRPHTALKILLAGGFGVGKTTMVGAVSEIRPLRTEEPLTEPGRLTDSTAGVEGKTTTTVAMDFGRITLRDDLALYLFGTPGQERFWFMWDELAIGALGAVVLADTRRLPGCFPAVDYFERRQLPFIVAVNCFNGAQPYTAGQVRTALDLDPGHPVVLCDARSRESAKQTLIALVEYVLLTARDAAGDRGGASAGGASAGGAGGAGQRPYPAEARPDGSAAGAPQST